MAFHLIEQHYAYRPPTCSVSAASSYPTYPETPMSRNRMLSIIRHINADHGPFVVEQIASRAIRFADTVGLRKIKAIGVWIAKPAPSDGCMISLFSVETSIHPSLRAGLSDPKRRSALSFS